MNFPKKTLATGAGLISLALVGCNTVGTENTELTADTNAKAASGDIMINRVSETKQQLCFSTTDIIDCSATGEFTGQDAQFTGNPQSYTLHGDGTVTDNVTGIMWTRSPDINGDGTISKADKLSSGDAVAYCESLDYAGYNDWQLPTIKQGYSLINFRGTDTDPMARDTSMLTPFVDTNAFDFAYGNPNDHERVIDSQYASTSKYVNDEGVEMLFGVNLADGRIKGYEEDFFGSDKTYFVQCMRGNTDYGTPGYVDNGDKTITDVESGLMWAQDDSGAAFEKGINYKDSLDWIKSDDTDTSPLVEGATMNGAMDWVEALAYVQQMNDANYLGYSDWRLPNVKELESIVDFSKSPVATGTAAIDPIFNMTTIVNENGDDDWAFYWSNTTHKAYDTDNNLQVNYASYVTFGRSMGYSETEGKWVDVHGAGSQRSDPKVWDGTNYSGGHGPQLDSIRIYNYVRLVRDAS